MTISILLLFIFGVGVWLARQDYSMSFGARRRELTRLHRRELALKTWNSMVERDRKF